MESLKMYSQEWWAQAEKWASQQEHRCYKCHRVRGEPKNARKHALSHGSDRDIARVDVRLVVVSGKPLLACTRCVPWPKEVGEDKKLINELTLPMFGGDDQQARPDVEAVSTTSK